MLHSVKLGFLLLMVVAGLCCCSQQDGLISADESAQTTEEDVAVVFRLQSNQSSNTTRSVDDSYKYVQGSPEEYKVNNARVYLFDAPTKLFVKSFLLTSLTHADNDAAGNIIYEAEKVLVSVGRRANLQGLEALEGLEIERGAIKIDEFCKTNLPNVYACGDVTGKIMLAHVAARQAEVAVGRMLKQIPLQRIAYNAIPSVVYTNPEIASVGITEAQAESMSVPVEVKTLPMTFSGRFMAENEGETGLCKMIVDAKKHSVLGVHMIGNPCSEFVAAASFAVRMGYTTAEFRQVVFPHPTVSEILHEIID